MNYIALFAIAGIIIAQSWGRFSFRGWLLQFALAFDQLVNVLVTPFHAGAWADETLSSRAYRMHRDGKPWGKFWMPVIDWIFFWQDGHCKHAYEVEALRLQVPPELRG